MPTFETGDLGKGREEVLRWESDLKEANFFVYDWLRKKWAGPWGPVAEQTVNLGNHPFLSSAVLCLLGPLVNFCFYGGETGLQERDEERGERNGWKMVG